MSYKLTIYFSDGSFEEVDEIFETEEDAMDEYDSWLENWGAGKETLQLAGESYLDADIIDYDIINLWRYLKYVKY